MSNYFVKKEDWLFGIDQNGCCIVKGCTNPVEWVRELTDAGYCAEHLPKDALTRTLITIESPIVFETKGMYGCLDCLKYNNQFGIDMEKQPCFQMASNRNCGKEIRADTHLNLTWDELKRLRRFLFYYQTLEGLDEIYKRLLSYTIPDEKKEEKQ